MIENRNVSIIQDENRNNVVIINDRRFKGLTKDDWESIEKFLKGYISDCYEITETSESVYIGSEFPSEFAGSKSRIALKGARKKQCNKKSINKQFIENLVIDECLKLLTDERMQYIAKKVSDECSRNPDNMSIKYLKSSIKEIDDAIENMWISIEKGGYAVALTERINRRKAEKRA